MSAAFQQSLMVRPAERLTCREGAIHDKADETSYDNVGYIKDIQTRSATSTELTT